MLELLRFIATGRILALAALGWLLVTPLARAQSLTGLTQAGGASTDQGLAITTDEQGNRYVTGSFSGTATFGSTQLISVGSSDIFVAKYDAAGSLKWVQRGGGSGDDVGNGIAVGSDGVYITGSFTGTANFNTPSSPSSNTLVSPGALDMFVAKYNTDGQLAWLRRGGGTTNDYGYGIAVGSDGVYVTGNFSSTANFNTPSSPSSNTLVQNSNGDMFVAKYNTDGQLAWLRRGGGGGSDYGYGIAVGSSGVYVTGYFQRTANFNTPSSPNSNTLVSVGETDVFVAKYDASGSLAWLRRGGGTTGDVGRGIAVGSDGVYVTGSFNNTADFNTPSNPSSTTLVSPGGSDMFVAKYDAAGSLAWLRRGGGSDSDQGNGIALGSNEVYVTGSFNNTADFNTPSNPSSTTLVSPGGSDMFVAKYDAAGSLAWLRRGGGSGNDQGNGIALGSNEVYVTGSFTGTANFNTPSSPSSNTLVAVRDLDIFVASYTPSLPVPTLTGLAASPTTVCVGSLVSVTATVGNFTGTYSYTLSQGNLSLTGTSTSSAFSQTLTMSASGTQTVTLTVSTASQSISTTTSVVVNAPPPAGLSNDGPLSCARPSVVLSATGGGTYQFEPGLPTSWASATVTTAGVYSVTVTGTNGCSQVASTTVTDNTTPPVASMVASGSLTCSTTSVTLTATGGSTYVFSGPGVVSSDASSGTALVNAAGTYSVTVTGSNGCTATTTVTVTGDPAPPTVSLVVSGSLNCSVTSVTLTASAQKVLAPDFTYVFSPGASQIGNGPTATVSSSGEYSVTAIGPNGCSQVASTTVTGDTTPPTASLDNDGPLTCAKTSVTLTAAGGTAYQFSAGATPFGDGSTATVTTWGSYSVTVTGANGCTATASVTVDEDLQMPSAALFNNGPLSCTAASVTIQVSTNGSSPFNLNGGAATRAILYTYAFSDGATQIDKGPSATVTAAGVYSVTVTGANSCFSVASTTVTSDPSPNLIGTQPANVTVTAGQTAQFELVSPIAGLSYQWQLDTGNGFADLTSDATYSGVMSATLSVAGTATAMSGYAYRAVVTSGVCSATSTSAVLTVNPTPQPDLTLLLYALPSTVYGATPVTVVIDVLEIERSATRGAITLVIAADPVLTFSLSPNATTVGGRLVNNSGWSLSGPTDGFYTLTTNQSIEAGKKVSVGITGTLTPGKTKGSLSISATMVGGSGGEVRINNNSDADKINYFNK